MSRRRFRLGRFVRDRSAFVGIVDDADAVLRIAELQELDERFRAAETIDALLADWDAAFAALDAAFQAGGRAETMPLAGLKPLPTVTRPGKVLNAAANYRDHVAGMARNFTSNLPQIDPSRPLPTLEPYLFAKACAVTGAEDDIILPTGMVRIDWEVELAVVIGRAGKRLGREQVADHVAGYMIGNDISCRDRTWREDRPAIRSDWLAGKSYDSFSPIGPLLLPRAFVPDYRDLRLRLWINGVLKQDGVARDMIFDLEDQIGWASNMMTLRSGDVLHTGTPAGTGQERGEFLAAGDLVEAQIDGCGRQRNRVVAEANVTGAG